MIYKAINLMLPTYHRHDAHLPRFIDSAEETADDLSKIFYTMVVNQKDTKTKEYLEKRLGDTGRLHILYENLAVPNLAKYYNMAYAQTKFNDPDTLVSMVGDDMIFKTPGLDSKVLEVASLTNGMGIIYLNDGYPKNDQYLCVNIFTSRQFVDANLPEPFMCELFPADFIDTIWWTVARSLGKYIYLPNVVLYHNHSRIVGIDETWTRLRRQMTISEQSKGQFDDICKQQYKRMKKNLAPHLESEIDVAITTYNRLPLFLRTVNGISTAYGRPKNIHVFDDVSDHIDTVKTICEKNDIVLHEGKEHFGVEKNNLRALRWMFENGSKAVLVVDSDTEVANFWWNVVTETYTMVKDSDNFGAICFLNDSKNPGMPSNLHPHLLEKHGLGGCGLLVTKDFWQKYVVPLEQSHQCPWDKMSTLNAFKDGKINYATTATVIQHNGILEGVHARNNGAAIGLNFSKQVWIPSKHSVDEKIENKSVLFSCPCRYGDMIMGSMLANMIGVAGFPTTVVFMQNRAELAQKIYLPDIKLIPADPNSYSANHEWVNMSTLDLKKYYGDKGKYKYFINATPGSVEHHNDLMSSGIHIIDFMRKRIEEILQVKLPEDYTEYLVPLKLEKYKFEYKYDYDKPLALIVPEAISTKPVIDQKIIDEISEKYFSTHNIRILVTVRPDNVPWRVMKNTYLFGLTFEQCLQLALTADTIFSNDSGMAWASLYNKECKKFIYHTKERIRLVNTFFERLDPNAKDIIV